MKIDHFGLLSPISPLSPLILNSPTGQSSLLKSVTNDSVSTSTSTSSPLNRQTVSQKSSLASHHDYFEQYLSDTFSILDKQELSLSSNFSVSQRKWSKSPDPELLNPIIQDNQFMSDLNFMSEVSQAGPGSLEKSSQPPVHGLLKKNAQLNQPDSLPSNKQSKFNSKSPSPSLPRGQDFNGNDNHRHKESTSTFSSEVSEKMSVMSHTTRASSVSSGFGHSRQSSKNNSFDAGTSTAPISFKPSHKPENSIAVSESLDDDTFFGTQSKVPKHFHKKSNSLNDVTINLTPPSFTMSRKEAQTSALEQYENPLLTQEMDPNLKDLDQKGLKITTPVPPPRSKFRVQSIDKEHTGPYSNLPSIPKNEVPPTPNPSFYDSNIFLNPSLPTPPQCDLLSPMSQENSAFSPLQDSLHSQGTSAASSRKNSKSSQKCVPYYLNKDLPDLPSEGSSSRKNSYKKFPHLNLPTPQIPSGNTSRTPSICDWEYINNNLDAINMSICKWDQSQNSSNDMHSSNTPKKSSSHNLVASESKPPGFVSQVPPRAIDISSMERSPPSKNSHSTQKHSLKGYDLTGQVYGKSKHLKQKSISAITSSQGYNYLTTLVPPPVITDFGTSFGAHKKSASTASSPSSVYTEFQKSQPSQPSIAFQEKCFSNAEYVSISSDHHGDSQSFTRQQPPRSMSVPTIPIDQQKSISKFKKDYEAKFTQKEDDIEEESLLPAPLGPGVTLLPSASSSTTSLQQKFGNYQQPDLFQANRLYLLENNSASRISRQAFNASNGQRESFTTSFTEAISMPEAIKELPQQPICSSKGSFSAFTSPRAIPRGPPFAKPFTSNGKTPQSINLRSKSITAMTPNKLEIPNERIYTEKTSNYMDKQPRERSMSLSGSNHQRALYNSSVNNAKEAQVHTLRKPGSMNNLRNPFSSVKQNSSNDGIFGDFQVSPLTNSKSPSPARFYNESPSPFSSPNAPEFFMNYNGSCSNLNSKKISSNPSSSNSTLYNGEINISTGMLNPVTTLYPNDQPVLLNNGSTRWKWKRPSLSIGKKQ